MLQKSKKRPHPGISVGVRAFFYIPLFSFSMGYSEGALAPLNSGRIGPEVRTRSRFFCDGKRDLLDDFFLRGLAIKVNAIFLRLLLQGFQRQVEQFGNEFCCGVGAEVIGNFISVVFVRDPFGRLFILLISQKSCRATV